MIAWDETGAPMGYADPRIETGAAQQAHADENRRAELASPR